MSASRFPVSDKQRIVKLKTDRLIALDIGADSLRLAVFARRGPGRLELVDHGSALLASEPQDMAREAVVATALKRLLDEKKPSVRKAIVSIDGQSIFSRVVKLPPVAADRMEQTISHEAVQNIPFPINEVVWDSHVFEPSASGPEVLLVAAKVELVDGLVHAVAANGLMVDAVDVAPAALVNTIRFNYPEITEPMLLVDIGAASTNLVFLDGSRCLFRTLPVSGGEMPRLLQEIERSITFYRTQQGGNAPQRIMLSGSSGQLAGFNDAFDMPVELVDPFRKLSDSASVSGDVRLGVLVGLALRGATGMGMAFDLEPASLKRAKELRCRQPLWFAIAGVAALIGMVWIGGLNHMAFQMQQEAEGISIRIDALNEVEQRLLPLEKRMEELEIYSRVYREAIGERAFWVETLAELRDRLPEGMFVLESEPLREGAGLTGMRITVVSYLDKEPDGEDAVVLLRDSLRESRLFDSDTKVFKRPTKRLFARQFVLDVFFAEPVVK